MPIRDERGIIASWLIKILVGFAIFAVIAFDVGSVLVNYFTLDSAADDVAIAVSTDVSENLGRNWTDHEIHELAVAQVETPGSGFEDARVLRQGTTIDDEGVVQIRLRRVANTLVVSRIGAIEDWARATANGRAGTR